MLVRPTATSIHPALVPMRVGTQMLGAFGMGTFGDEGVLRPTPEEVDAAVGAMMSLLEPLLIVFMGGAVGFIVIALFMPLIKLIEQLGAQAN